MMTTLADLDTAFETSGECEITRATFDALPAPWLSNGTYTLTFPCGTHRTFRVRLDRKGIHAGKRTIALLIGPDNTADYDPVGIVGEHGFELWRRHRTGKIAEQAKLLWDLARGESIEGYELLVSKVCRVCNRPLTDAESIRVEIGPICRERLGM
jgi:hypothetical protein